MEWICWRPPLSAHTWAQEADTGPFGVSPYLAMPTRESYSLQKKLFSLHCAVSASGGCRDADRDGLLHRGLSPAAYG